MVSAHSLPTSLGGDAPRRRPSVRVLAAFAEHADCNLASLGFALGVDFDQLLAGTRYAVPLGQSPFAFARGTRFEQSLREGGYGLVLDLLRRSMGFAVEDARLLNLREGYPKNRHGLKLRARATRRAIDAMLRDDPRAPNLIDGAVFETSLGGVPAYFEADAVAARSRGPIRVGEVKSFPVVDDRADPEKLSAALDQASHYVLLARQVAADLGHDPATILSEAMLITPRNVGLRPMLSIKDIAGRVRRAERILARVPSLADVAALAPPGMTFSAITDRRPLGDRRADLPDADADRRIDALHTFADHVGTTYSPSCVATCGLGRFCRSRQFTAASPHLAGSKIARLLPGVHSLDRAANLADGAVPGPTEGPVAAQLARAARLYDRYGAPLLTGTGGRS